MEKYSRGQIALLWVWGCLWLACNAAWVWASSDCTYIYDDSLIYLGVLRTYKDWYLSNPWWIWDVPAYIPTLALLSSLLSVLFTEPLGTQTVAFCITVQAFIILANYAALAWLGRELYGARAGVMTALLFLSLYMVDCTVRSFMVDGLLGLTITLFFCCSVRLRRHHFSLSTCVWWAVALVGCALTKWTALFQWLPFYLLFVLFSVCREQVQSSTYAKGKAWLCAGAEVLAWVIAGLLIAGLEYKLDVGLINAIFGVSVVIFLLRHRLAAMPPLRRFLIVVGLILSVVALFWLTFHNHGMYSQLMRRNARFSGALLNHIQQYWFDLCLDMLRLIGNCVLLPVTFAIFLGSCVYTLVKPRKFSPSFRILTLSIIPGLCINAFFFNMVVVRYLTAILGLMALVMGGVLACGKRWWVYPLLGWCLFAKLVFMGGWVVSSSLPAANDKYLWSDILGMRGIEVNENTREVVLASFKRQLKLEHDWADAAIFTGYPYNPPELELMYSVCEKTSRANGKEFGLILTASAFEEGFDNGFFCNDNSIREIGRRRGCTDLELLGGDPNGSLFTVFTKISATDLRRVNTLVVMYCYRRDDEQLVKLERHVRTYLSGCWHLIEHYESGGPYDVAVFRADPQWFRQIRPLLTEPPTPLLPGRYCRYRDSQKLEL